MLYSMVRGSREVLDSKRMVTVTINEINECGFLNECFNVKELRVRNVSIRLVVERYIPPH